MGFCSEENEKQKYKAISSRVSNNTQVLGDFSSNEAQGFGLVGMDEGKFFFLEVFFGTGPSILGVG